MRRLHVEGDEDHVAAQFNEKKGDLERGETGRKNNALMPKLVRGYEDIVEECGESSRNKRYRLTGKRYFCGLYSGKDNERLWEEVRDYICETYDWESLETIYIAGDGAGWIKAGGEVLEKGKFVLDRFHMGKYIDRSVSHLLEKEPGGAWGCHAEGQVSHVLSNRMSSRPMGWSRKGADQMPRLRAYRMNGGKIIDLVEYQEEKKRREEEIEKKEELVTELRKRQAGRKYAEQLQGSIPGVEGHSMKWMRDLVGQGTSYIACLSHTG